MSFRQGYRQGVADCVRVLERSAEAIAARPLVADVEAICANPQKRSRLVDLFLALAEELAELANDPDLSALTPPSGPQPDLGGPRAGVLAESAAEP